MQRGSTASHNIINQLSFGAATHSDGYRVAEGGKLARGMGICNGAGPETRIETTAIND